MVYAGCSFKSFSVFLLALKQQQNLVKILFSCIHFPVWPYPPKIMHKEKEEKKKKKVFYTGKLCGLAGMILNIVGVESPIPFLQAAQFVFLHALHPGCDYTHTILRLL